MSVRPIAEIISIGNELLIGKTLNSNAQWIAKELTVLGLDLRRITVIGDEIDEISNATRNALLRKPYLIITTGGLGPTFDDKTLSGIAEALEIDLEKNSEALKMIKEKFSNYVSGNTMENPGLTPARSKMGILPKGSKPILNPVGTAPGVLIEQLSTRIVILPGVPAEMKAIFTNSIKPLLRREAGKTIFFEASLLVTEICESDIAPLIDLIMDRNPFVYVKSHPKVARGSSKIELHFSTFSPDRDSACSIVNSALLQMSELIHQEGGKTIYSSIKVK